MKLHKFGQYLKSKSCQWVKYHCGAMVQGNYMSYLSQLCIFIIFYQSILWGLIHDVALGRRCP